MNFDVRTDPWIPVRNLSGEKQVIGLNTLFREAQNLEGFDELDVMEEYSLYRFLSLFLMAAYKPEIWDVYKDILIKSGEPFQIENIERFAFYERAKTSYAVVATGEDWNAYLQPGASTDFGFCANR